MRISTDFLQHFASGTLVQGTEGVSNNATGTMTNYYDAHVRHDHPYLFTKEV